MYHILKSKFNKKIDWKYPPKVKVIIYETYNSSVILEYTGKEDTYVLSSSTVNILILIHCLIRGRFSVKDYFVEYIKISKAKVIITSIDNDLFFWALKNHLPHVTTIMLQYGWHTELGDIFGELKRNNPGRVFTVDYMMVFNENIKLKYQSYINGNCFVGGSFKNNHFQFSSTEINKNTVLFVSQYRPEQVDHPVFFYEGGIPFFRDDFYVTEKKLLPLIYDYCNKKGFRLQISGHGTTEEERIFYNEIIGNFDWDFIPREGTSGNYETVHNAEFIVGVDSTLAYEAFGKGKRTAFFPGRVHSLNNFSYNFGWPGRFLKEGPFWTSYITEIEVVRVLDAVFTSSENDWLKIGQTYADEIMQYNPQNTKLVDILKREGIYKNK